MNNPVPGHPEGIDLLRFADGELGPKEARQVRQHLDSCWQCRTELEDIERTIGECVRYRNNVLRNNLPSPPAPWMDIHAAFSRLDAATGRGSFSERMFGQLRGGMRWLVPAAAAAALCVVLYQWRETPSVRAAELLKQASARAEAQPAKPRRIRIRTAARKLTRVVGVRPAAAEPEDALATMFRSANYSWDDPLSAKSFQAWRETLPQKRDEVSEADGSATIRTSSDSGLLASASLKLNAADLRPVEGRLEFRNKEIVEIAELPDELPAAEAAHEAAPRRLERAGAEAAPEPAQGRAPGAAEELKVMAALHGVGADLGDPLEVERTPSGIVVKGIGISPDRQREIRDALRAAPGAIARFTEPDAAPPEGGAVQSAGAPPAGDALRFQALVEKQLGGRAQFDDFSARLLEANEAAMSRVYALRRLAQRFPAGSESGLDAAGRASLTAMARDHAGELARAVANMEGLAAPAMRALGGSASAVQQKSTDSRAWQAATEELFQSAQRVERLLAAMLDGSPTAATTADLPAHLLTGIARLRAQAENYRRLLLLEPTGDGK